MINKNQYDTLGEEFKEKDKWHLNATRGLLHSRISPAELKGKKLLDLGCGYGEDLAHFSKFDCETYGVDISKKMIKLSRIKSPKSIFLQGDFQETFFENVKFDYIISRYSIQHAKNVKKVMLNLKKALKKGGEAILVTTHPFRQYFEKETKDYWHQELVYPRIFDETLTLEEYSHKLEDYFDPNFLKGMKLITMEEIFDPAAEAIKGKGKYPSVLLLHFKKLKNKSKRIAIFGSATNEKLPSHTQKEIMAKLNQENAEVSTGTGIGIPHQIIKACNKANIKTIGYSPARTEIKHMVADDNAKLKDFAKVKFIPGYTNRSIKMIEESDAALIIGGRMGTLSEFTIAFEEQKPIAVLTSLNGIAKHLKKITQLTKKHRKTPIFFDDNPKRLLDKLFDYLKSN